MAIITVSRGTFSGGKGVAEQLAERLGYPCVSREDIFEAAREFGLARSELSQAFEKPGFWRQSAGSRLDILNMLRTSLLKLSRGGNLVYHGFAGHLLLSEVSHLLRVRVIAGPEYRIEAAMRLRGLTRARAVALIKSQDKEGIFWARFLYGVELQDPSLYDVILNLERVGIDSATDTLLRMTELREFQPTAESLEAYDDLLLAGTVWARLSRDTSTRSASIRVRARRGEVVIEGKAGSESVLESLVGVARGVYGVRQVACEVCIGADWHW